MIPVMHSDTYVTPILLVIVLSYLHQHGITCLTHKDSSSTGFATVRYVALFTQPVPVNKVW